MYATQQQQKAEGRTRRKAQREAMVRFIAEFKAKNKREPTYEEIAAHFHRSHSWVHNLKRSAVTDAEEESGGGG